MTSDKSSVLSLQRGAIVRIMQSEARSDGWFFLRCEAVSGIPQVGMFVFAETERTGEQVAVFSVPLVELLEGTGRFRVTLRQIAAAESEGEQMTLAKLTQPGSMLRLAHADRT